MNVMNSIISIGNGMAISKEQLWEHMKRDVSRDLVHKSHCCTEHGCKYGEEDCPVVNKYVKQDGMCFDCIDEEMMSLEHEEWVAKYTADQMEDEDFRWERPDD